MPARRRTQGTDTGGRARLLAAAAKLFATKGYAATSVREILRIAKVTPPVLYYHFGSKEGLFVGLVRGALETLEAEEAKALVGALNAADEVHAFCRAHIAIQERYAQILWMTELLIAGTAQVAPRFDYKGAFASMVRRLGDLVGAAVEAGEFRRCDPTAAAFVLLGAVQMTTRMRMIQAHLPATVAPPEGILETALDGLRTPPGRANAKTTKHPRREAGS